MPKKPTPTAPPQTADDLLTPREVADMLGVHYVTLATWRAQSRGPRFIKLGGRPKSPVRYRRGAVVAYLDSRSAG